MVDFQVVESKPSKIPKKPSKPRTDWKGKFKALESKYQVLNTKCRELEGIIDTLSKRTKLNQDFWDAWNDLKPSLESVFKKSKWPSKHTSWRIIKRRMEELK